MDLEQKIKYIQDWLKHMVSFNNSNGLLLGMSGGLDSSVVAALIKGAMPDNSLGVIMPCDSDEVDKELALKVAKRLQIKTIEIDLTKEHAMIYSKVMETTGVERSRHSEAHLKSRLRMSTLYAIANNLNYLVVGTDNASSFYTGYFVKYGDGAVDLRPIIHLVRSEVRMWAEYFGIPKEVIDRTPTAGLWEGQTDEGEMGVSYHSIDNFIKGNEISEEHRAIIDKLHIDTQHKRRPPTHPPKFE